MSCVNISKAARRVQVTRRQPKTSVRRRRVNRRGRRMMNEGKSDALTMYKTPGPTSVFVNQTTTPERTFARLKYLEPAYATGAIPGATAYVDYYRVNSIFDPYVGVGGGVPAGFTRMFGQYLYVRILSASIRANFTRTEHGDDMSWTCAIVPLGHAQTLSPPTTFSQFIEQPGAIWRQGVSTFADQSHDLYMKTVVSKINGVPAVTLSDLAFWHTSSTNPGFNTHWALVVMSPLAGFNLTNVNIQVEITYDCEFFMRGAIPGSFLERDPPDHKLSHKIVPIGVAAELVRKPTAKAADETKSVCSSKRDHSSSRAPVTLHIGEDDDVSLKLTRSRVGSCPQANGKPVVSTTTVATALTPSDDYDIEDLTSPVPVLSRTQLRRETRQT